MQYVGTRNCLGTMEYINSPDRLNFDLSTVDENLVITLYSSSSSSGMSASDLSSMPPQGVVGAVGVGVAVGVGCGVGCGVGWGVG